MIVDCIDFESNISNTQNSFLLIVSIFVIISPLVSKLSTVSVVVEYLVLSKIYSLQGLATGLSTIALKHSLNSVS